MNSWKIVWNAFHRHSSSWSYAKELWRLSGNGTRVFFTVSAVSFLASFAYLTQNASNTWAFTITVATEIALLLTAERMKGSAFSARYGSSDVTMSPAEDQDHRPSRFLIFSKTLRDAAISRSHVVDLFDVADAHFELDSQRNLALNRFLYFVSGVCSALLIAWLRDLKSDEVAAALVLSLVALLFLVPMFWFWPSRKEKLKELKYFMLLYAKGID